MATGKTVKKAGAAKAAVAKRPAAAKAVVKPAGQAPKAAVPRPASAQKPLAPPRQAAGPTARACPLVLDGEIDAADFSPGDCLTCSEFDCRFCEAEAGSGTLRSRLFAGADDDQEAEDAWGGDVDFEGGEEVGGDVEEGDGDPF